MFNYISTAGKTKLTIPNCVYGTGSVGLGKKGGVEGQGLCRLLAEGMGAKSCKKLQKAGESGDSRLEGGKN